MATRPSTRGTVLLRTSAGDWKVQLWSEQIPLACRRFLSLCALGWWEDAAISRVVPKRFVQVTSNRSFGDDVKHGVGTIKKESHGRLRFDRRGVVALAKPWTEVDEEDDASFFVTLDRCSDLDGNHTIFGTIEGESIYSVAQVGELETDDDDRPLECPKIIEALVLENPFEDLDLEELRKKRMAEIEEEKKALERASEARLRKKRKKDAMLLSFGEEVENEETELKAGTDLKIKSKHELMMGDKGLVDASNSRVLPRDAEKDVPCTILTKTTGTQAEEENSVKVKETTEEETVPDLQETIPSVVFGGLQEIPLQRVPRGTVPMMAVEDLHRLRAKYRKGRKAKGTEEGFTLNKLEMFCSKLRRGRQVGAREPNDKAASDSPDQENPEEDGPPAEDGKLWHAHKLRFKSKGEREELHLPDDYVVIDPLSKR